MATEGEDGITNDSNVFASLMPNLFSRLQHCDETVSEQEFQEIHSLLNLARSDDDLIKGNSSLIPFLKQREEKDNEVTQEEVKKRPSPLIKSDYGSGKENALPTKLPQRNKLSRRERSSRVTTHRKPFVVDIRKFGSILNSNALGKCTKPQNVHAFWEAADEREASEAIMSKLRGIIEQRDGNGDTTLRRVGVRRKNSQRTTTRLKRFAVELPACGEQVQSLDEEQLEEEEDATQESSFTFLSNPEFRAHNHLFELSNAEKYIKASQLGSSIQSAEKYVEIVDLDGTAKLSCQEEDDNDILSDGKSSLVSKGTGQCSFGLKDIAASKDGSDECEKPAKVPDILSDAPSHQAVDKNSAEVIDTGNGLEMKATPYNRNIAAKRTPFTSPTPPSNPLAAFGLRKDNVMEDISKRRLDFDDNNMNSTTLELASTAPIMHISPVFENPSASPEVPQAQVEVISPSDVTLVHILPVLQKPSSSPEVPQAQVEVEEENVELAEEVNTKAPDVAEEVNTKTPDVVPTVLTKMPEQNAKKPLKKAIAKRKKPMNDRRNSLIGAGTNWNEGQRRSTRIRSRPLEWWRGERFLVGRVHKSLATVIGIKYSSPPPCWPKRGTKAPQFKVESYVSEEYAKYVQFAALY